MDSIHLPNAIALPNAFGAPGTPLSPGQVVQALVLELIQSDVFRLQLPQAVVDVRSDVALTPGSTITLAATGGGANTKLIIYSDTPAAMPKGQGPSLAGRQPIGEAVVIARAPGPLAGPAEPAAVRDMPPIAPIVASREAAPLRAVTPQEAVGQAMRAAASRQGGLAPLFADLEQVGNALPTPVRTVADQLLGLRVPLGPQLTAADVKQAFARSGVLFEPLLARNAPAGPARMPSIIPNRPEAGARPSPADDLKAALLVFRQVLKTWAASEPVQGRAVAPLNSAAMASEAPIAQRPLPATDAAISRLANALAGAPEESKLAGAPLSPDQAATLAKTVASALSARDAPAQPSAGPGAPPPPYRGAPLTAQAPAASSLASDAAPREIADKLLAEGDGALARQTLLQIASLPDQPDLPRTDTTQRWSFEIPFATPQGTSIAQFEVSRDACAPQADPQARTWRARFSLDVEPMGPVHALVALSGARTSVTLWAERPATATRLTESAPMLSDALRAAELEPAEFQLRVGAPAVLRQAAPGRFMDRAT